MTTRYFSSLIEQSLSRSTEATLSIMGVTNPQLREHLAQQMGADCGKPGSFLASPVLPQERPARQAIPYNASTTRRAVLALLTMTAFR
ncbi:hypothetical protein D9J38_13695 [Escherichia coli]|nr:hypothetical protein [Escherichia coli]